MEKVRSGGRKEVKLKELNKKKLFKKLWFAEENIWTTSSLLHFPIMDCVTGLVSNVG